MPNRLVERFLALAVVPSPSKKEGPMAAAINKELSAMGLAAEEDGAAAQLKGEVGNLFTERLPSGEPTGWVTLSCHMDAVPPGCANDPYIDGDIVRTRGACLAADDRAGVAIALQILDDLVERPLLRTGVQVIFTVSEETGDSGADVLDPKLVKGKWVVVLDTGGKPGQMNIQSPHANAFKVVFRGKAAHAGIEPEKGANALLMAARTADRFASGRLNPDTTFCFTKTSSGKSTNVIPEEAVLEGETRSFKDGETERLLNGLKDLSESTAGEFGGTAEFESREQFPPFKLDKDHQLVEALVRAAEECGFRPEPRRTGGGSDANGYNAKGIPAVNVAVGYRQPHSKDEHLIVPEFLGTYRWITRFLRSVDEVAG